MLLSAAGILAGLIGMIALFLNRAISTRVARTDLPDFTQFARRADIQNIPDMSGVVHVQQLECELRTRDLTIQRLIEALRTEEALRISDIARLEELLGRSKSEAAAAATPSPAFPAKPDNLELIYGIGPVLSKRLNRLGITTFAQIAQWTDVDIDRIEPQLDTIQGRIRREGWVADARRLNQEKHGERLNDAAGARRDS
jgi:predicted flap endonuclease-1-like 5' DNA nuclease